MTPDNQIETMLDIKIDGYACHICGTEVEKDQRIWEESVKWICKECKEMM